MMALSTGAFVFRIHQATGAVRATSETSSHKQETLLFGMPVWQDDETSMEGQGREQKHHKSSHMTQANLIGGPIGVQLPWLYCPTQGQAHATTL